MRTWTRSRSLATPSATTTGLMSVTRRRVVGAAAALVLGAVGGQLGLALVGHQQVSVVTGAAFWMVKEGDVNVEAFDALVDSGFRGAANDGVEAVYVPMGTVVDFAGGSVSVLADGPMVCVDGSGGVCAAPGYVVVG